MKAVPLLVLALLPSGNGERVVWTGHQLVQACSQQAAADPGSDCAVYVRSVVQRYHELMATHCPRAEARFADILRGVTAYLAQHPAELDRDGSALVLDSFKRGYGCAW